jgi:predicted lactoylglutathione lyase
MGFKYIEWNLIWINFNLNELNSNSTKFYSKIGLNFNWREMGCKSVEKVLKIGLWIWC